MTIVYVLVGATYHVVHSMSMRGYVLTMCGRDENNTASSSFFFVRPTDVFGMCDKCEEAAQ